MLITVLGIPLNGWAALSIGIQFLLPLLVGLVTTRETNKERKFVLLAGLTLLATVGTQVYEAYLAGREINRVSVLQIVISAVINLVISLLSHYGIWKPNNISALMLALFSHKTPDPLPPGVSSLAAVRIEKATPVAEEPYEPRHSL